MKYQRRYTRITYEGMSYVLVLGFIILGSIIRQINLLVLLAGLMIAPFFFNWRISMKMVERLWARRRLPNWVHASTSFQVNWEIGNDRTGIPAWGIRVNDTIRNLPLLDGNKRGEPESIVALSPVISPGSTVTVSYRCFLPDRGTCEFGPAETSSAFPAGLMRSRLRHRETETLSVAPALGTLNRSWDRLLQSTLPGENANRQRHRNQDGEFYAIRAWQSGDSPRQVHWRSSAKQGELMVRQLEQQVRQDVVLVLDLADSKTDLEWTLQFFTTALCKISRQRIGLTVGLYAESSLVIPQVNRGSLDDAMKFLAIAQPTIADTQIASELSELVAKAKSSRVVVISTRSQNKALGQKNGDSEDVAVPLSCLWIDTSHPSSQAHFGAPQNRDVDFVMETLATKEVSSP